MNIFKNFTWGLLFFVFFSCEKVAEKEIYLIPSDYKGRIVIFYNQSQGKPLKYLLGYRIYNISRNGTLVTQFPPNDGWSSFNDHCYFQIDDDKNINLIPYRRMGEDINNPPDSVLQIFGSTTGKNGNLIYHSFYFDKFNKRTSKNIIQVDQEWNEMKRRANVIER